MFATLNDFIKLPLTPQCFTHTLLLYIIGVCSVKFKIIFTLFNIVILISFIIIFFMPFFMLGWDYTKEFWVSNWYLPIIFIVIMTLLNGYFISNWKLFNLLENEDWKQILEYTFRKINSGSFTKQQIKIFINAALVNSDLDKIREAQKVIWVQKPGWKDEFVLYFGIPYLLGNDPPHMLEYFREFLEITTRDRQWVLWNFAFALMMNRQFDEAKVQLAALKDSADNPVVRALTGYLAHGFAAGDEQMRDLEKSVKERLVAEYPRPKWDSALAKAKENVQAAVLSQLINDAEAWLFSKGDSYSDGKEVQ